MVRRTEEDLLLLSSPWQVELNTRYFEFLPSVPMRIRILLYAICASVLASGALISADPALARDAAIKNPEPDRVAYAVEGAESSHGRNASMWRTNLEGPQGPMQVSE